MKSQANPELLRKQIFTSTLKNKNGEAQLNYSKPNNEILGMEPQSIGLYDSLFQKKVEPLNSSSSLTSQLQLFQ